MDELIELVRLAAGREHRVLAEPGSEGEQRARANGYSEPIIVPEPSPEKSPAKTQKTAT